MHRIVKRPFPKKSISVEFNVAHTPAAPTVVQTETHTKTKTTASTKGEALPEIAPTETAGLDAYQTVDSRNSDKALPYWLTFGESKPPQPTSGGLEGSAGGHRDKAAEELTSRSEEPPLVQTKCGHDGVQTFSCRICRLCYCVELCLSENICCHRTCKACHVSCSLCMKHVCLQCMIRCSECLDKLCSIQCASKCIKCQKPLCGSCLAKRHVTDKSTQCLCARCVDAIVKGNAQDTHDSSTAPPVSETAWVALCSQEGKPTLIVSTEGKGYSLQGRYIGKFVI